MYKGRKFDTMYALISNDTGCHNYFYVFHSLYALIMIVGFECMRTLYGRPIILTIRDILISRYWMSSSFWSVICERYNKWSLFNLETKHHLLHVELFLGVFDESWRKICQKMTEIVQNKWQNSEFGCCSDMGNCKLKWNIIHATCIHLLIA